MTWTGSLTFDGTNHGPIAGPFLCIRQVGDGIQVGGNELAAWVLANAQCCVLDFVVVDVPVVAHNHCLHLHQQSFQTQHEDLYRAATDVP